MVKDQGQDQDLPDLHDQAEALVAHLLVEALAKDPMMIGARDLAPSTGAALKQEAAVLADGTTMNAVWKEAKARMGKEAGARMGKEAEARMGKEAEARIGREAIALALEVDQEGAGVVRDHAASTILQISNQRICRDVSWCKGDSNYEGKKLSVIMAFVHQLLVLGTKNMLM